MIDAISGLGARLSIGQAQGGAAAGAQVAAHDDFGAVLSRIGGEAVGTLKTAESASMSGLYGKASAQQVVSAILAAEHTLQTAIAIRDKTVNAYLELTRMQI